MSTSAKWACGSLPGSRSCSSVEYTRDNPEWRRPSGRPQSSWLKQAHWSCRELFGMERVSTYWAAYTPKEWSGQAGTATHPLCVCMPSILLATKTQGMNKKITTKSLYHPTKWEPLLTALLKGVALTALTKPCPLQGYEAWGFCATRWRQETVNGSPHWVILHNLTAFYSTTSTSHINVLKENMREWCKNKTFYIPLSISKPSYIYTYIFTLWLKTI